MKEQLIHLIKKILSDVERADEDDIEDGGDVFDRCGGNFDDAYQMGVRSGEFAYASLLATKYNLEEVLQWLEECF